MRIPESLKQKIIDSLLDEERRYRFLFLCVYGLLSLISAGMTLLNIFTHKGMLTWSTLLFAVLGAALFALLLKEKIRLCVSKAIFVVSFYVLLTFFIISGIPEGFSILWVCLLPACGLLTFGRKGGSLLCAGMFLIVLFLLETPWGLALVQYPYSATFRMRFPLLYSAFYLASLLLESIRLLTQKKLAETQQLYRYLYAHDALTDLYNRYGFNERMDQLFSENAPSLALVILDIDHFKEVNDLYGHPVGDAVLQRVGAALMRGVGARGSVCRWGGEEFAVLIPACENVAAEAEALLALIRAEAISAGEETVSVTASVGGVRVAEAAKTTPALLVNAADGCLYQAKKRGRNQAFCCEI